MNYERAERESVSEAVVLAVASAEGCEPTDLPPLTGTLNPDALEGLFACAPDGTPGGTVSLSFIYSHSQVTITDTGSIEVVPMPVT